MTRRFLVPLVLTAVALTACSSATPAPAPAPAPTFVVPAAPPPAPAAQAKLDGTYAASSIERKILVWKRWAHDKGATWTFDTQNPVGERLAMLVTGQRTDDAGQAWVRVLLPIRPNEADGWVHAEDVTLKQMDEKIVIDLSSRMLTRYVDGEREQRFQVGIGRPEWPTATGTYYVWAHVPQASPTGPYGVFALGISGFSEVLKDWPGGGRMAIHGTPYASNLGQMVSHGCVRVYNPEMQELKKVPLGTPVIIRA